MGSQKKFTMEFLKLMEIEKFISLLQSKNEFYEHISFEKKLSNNTVLSYKSDIDLFERFITNSNFKDQTVETVVRKYITKKSVMGMSGRTNNRFISSLKKFLKFFLKDNYINFINVKSPKFTNKLPNILNVEEVERLLNFKPAIYEDYLDKVILEVLYSSGLRLSELINLQDKNQVSKLFKVHPEISGVIHFAAYKAVGESVLKPLEYYENNLGSLINVIKEIEKKKIALLTISSCNRIQLHYSYG